MQRTISGLTEARVVFKGTAAVLGLSEKKLRDGLASGEVAQEQFDRAQRTFLSVSGNLENMQIDRNEIDFQLSGLDKLDPKAMKEIRKIANSPGGQAFLAGSAAGKKGGSKKSNKQKK